MIKDCVLALLLPAEGISFMHFKTFSEEMKRYWAVRVSYVPPWEK